jgi:hypothetical protein
MPLSRLSILVLAAAFVAPHVSAAQDGSQRKPIELGMDASVMHETSDRVDATALSVPVSRLRIGLFLTNTISLEPSLQFGYSRVTFKNVLGRGDVTNSTSSYDVDLGLMVHFRPERTKAQPYVRPFLGIRGYTSSVEGSQSDGSASQTSFGAAAGVKVPFADRLGGRFEVGYAHDAENRPQFAAANRLFLTFGVSFFTH